MRRMTVLPKMMSQWFEAMERDHRMLDHQINSMFNEVDRRFPFYNRFPKYLTDEKRGWSENKADKDKFRVMLDVQQFKPEEIDVKIVDNQVVIEGKHEEKHDDHGMISRHFIRKYMIPDRCIPEKATCSLTSDGVLTITAPSRPEEKPHERPLKIDFIQSEQPKSIENNNSSNEANETNQEATKISAKN